MESSAPPHSFRTFASQSFCSKREPHDLDPDECFDTFVANDEIQWRGHGCFCAGRSSRGRRRIRGSNTGPIRATFTRWPFVLFVPDVQETNDKELLARPGDLIE